MYSAEILESTIIFIYSSTRAFTSNKNTYKEKLTKYTCYTCMRHTKRERDRKGEEKNST